MLLETESKTILDVNDDLAGFIGSENLYQHGMFKKKGFTEGVLALAESYECFWLIDDIMIFSTGIKEVRTQPFQVWKLQREMETDHVTSEVVSRKRSFNLVCEDGNGNGLWKYHYPIAIFPGDTVKLFYANDVLYLPSEH